MKNLKIRETWHNTEVFNKGYESHNFAITLFVKFQLEDIHNLTVVLTNSTCPERSWTMPRPPRGILHPPAVPRSAGKPAGMQYSKDPRELQESLLGHKTSNVYLGLGSMSILK